MSTSINDNISKHHLHYNSTSKDSLQQKLLIITLAYKQKLKKNSVIHGNYLKVNYVGNI